MDIQRWKWALLKQDYNVAPQGPEPIQDNRLYVGSRSESDVYIDIFFIGKNSNTVTQVALKDSGWMWYNQGNDGRIP